MSNFTRIRPVLVALVLAVLALSGGASLPGPQAAPESQSQLRPQILDGDTVSVIAENAVPQVLINSTFFTVRRDLRRCAAPLCGGYYVRPVNHLLVACTNGRLAAECYVAKIDWNGQTEVDAGKALLRGEVLPKAFGDFGVFRVSESWQAASNHQPAGVFYRVRDRGVRCITFPCPSHREMKLNSSATWNIAGVNLKAAGANEDLVSQAFAAMTGGEGVLVSGSHKTVTGPGGRMPELKATQFYLRAGNSQAMKPCIRTGCSSQVCSDQNVITTCEYRAEYACYQKALCERQRDGNCGFTRTPELAACLSRTRR
jgi:hypothetical protein